MKAFDVVYSRIDEGISASVAADALENTEVRQLIVGYGGTCYEEGLYRIFNVEDARRWTETIRRFFSAESGGVEAFGRDWQGNVFGYRREGTPCVFLFQPGTGDVFEVFRSGRGGQHSGSKSGPLNHAAASNSSWKSSRV